MKPTERFADGNGLLTFAPDFAVPSRSCHFHICPGGEQG